MPNPATSGARMLCLILYSAIVTPQTKPMRVLVIDDDPMSRDLLAVLLQAEGYKVECAESGEAALAHLRNSTVVPNLVLADAQMPGLTGARLANELRSTCPTTTLMLAMSGSRPHEQVIAHFDGFLLKPFTMEQIADALEAHSPVSGRTKTPATRERWTVVRGPAGRSPANARLISIAATSAQPESNRGACSQPLQVTSMETLSTGLLVLNEEIYQRLGTSMPAPQLRQLYQMCVNDVRLRIASMRRLAEARDGAAFVREAHSIKGGCGMLGATELHRIATELEASGLGTTVSEGVQSVNSLDELASACDRLERILGSRA